MSRQSKRNEECNLYSTHYNDLGERIAADALDNRSIPTDTIGLAPEVARIGADIVELNTGRTGASKDGKTHKGEVTGGSDEVTNEHSRMERRSLKDRPASHERESLRRRGQ